MNFHQGDTRVIYSIEFSKDGKYLASSEFDGVLKMYDTNRFDLISSTPRMEEDRVSYIIISSLKYLRIRH